MRSKKVIALLLTTATLMGMTLTGCGNNINEDATFATLDGTTITMGVANFMARYEQAMYEGNYMSYFGDNMWSQDMYGNGTTLAEDVKNNLVENIQKLYLLKAHMEEYDVSLSQDDETAIAQAADKFIEDNSKKAIKQMGAENKENVIEMLRLNTIQQKMYNAIIKDVNTEVTDEEAKQRTFSYVEIDRGGYYDSESNYVEYTEEEKEGLKEIAATIAEATEFEAAVTEAGYEVSTASYGSAEDETVSLDTAVLEAADQLKPAEISDVIETESAYYVLRLDSEFDKEATEAKKEEIVQQRKSDLYTETVDGWKEKAEWTVNEEEWTKIQFIDHFSLPQEDTTEAVEEIDVTESTEAE